MILNLLSVELIFIFGGNMGKLTEFLHNIIVLKKLNSNRKTRKGIVFW